MDVETNFFNELTKPKDPSENDKNIINNSENFSDEQTEVNENVFDEKAESENGSAKT